MIRPLSLIVTDASPLITLAAADEDTNVGRSAFLRTIPAGVTALTTGDLLFELEAAGKIQSKDRILDAATLKDRNVLAQRAVHSDAASRAILRNALSRKDSGSAD